MALASKSVETRPSGDWSQDGTMGSGERSVGDVKEYLHRTKFHFMLLISQRIFIAVYFLIEWMLVMKNSWKIFSNDIKNVGTNWVAIMIISGLIILPSLYAWLNVLAAWDPYGQTDQIPVGVVNEDKGETIHDEEIDVGGKLVDSLEEDDSLEWHFLNRQKAMKQLEKGDLFAVVIIPEDFSERLGTIVKAQPEKANIEYYVNEKLNAITPKITDKGATVIVDDISSQFVSTVNGVIFEVFNEIGLELEKDLPDIERFENYVFEMEGRLPEILDTLEDTMSDADEAKDIVSKAQESLPEVKNVVDSGLTTIDETTDYLEETENRLNEMSPKIKDKLTKAQNTAADVTNFLDEVDTSTSSMEKSKEIKDKINGQVDESIEYVDVVQGTLEDVLKQIEEREANETDETDDGADEIEEPDEEQVEQLEKAIAKLDETTSTLEKGREYTSEVEELVDEKEEEVTQIYEEVKKQANQAEEQLNELSKEYNESIEPTVLAEIKNAKQTLSDAREILVGVDSTIPEVESLLNRTSGSLDDGKGMLEDILAEYPYVNDKIGELADSIRNAQDETDINKIIDLLQNDPEAERGFFSQPVALNEHSVFPVENYGSGMTPFYTVLSLWVGGTLLISLLSTGVNKKESFGLKEVYFGKLLTFTFIGFLQTLIVTLGDIFIVNVEIAHPILFVLFGLFCSLVFMTIIYTSVSMFGDVGKALVIVMLVLQIAGSGGTYPVVLLPRFFQAISPFLPFTYAIDIMREAVGGIVWSNVIFDVEILVLFSLIALVFGAFLKEPINKQTDKLIEKSRESGVFH